MAQPHDDPLLGQLIAGKFRVIKAIARGGMGRIYQGVQEPLGRLVAIKVLDVPGMNAANRDTFEKRFFLEASISSKLTHPNTVTIHDFGKVEGSDGLYIVMEFMRGRTLRKAIAEDGAFGIERALHVTKQICRSLREAHEAGVVHRDLKPSNIFILDGDDEGDVVKVFDFGLVKQLGDADHDLTASGAMLGTPRYMSPEQILAVEVDARTDIYAMGVILYEMLAGVPPFKSKSRDAAQIDLIMAQLNSPPPPLTSKPGGATIPAVIEQLVMKCLHKEPAHRFHSMSELLGAIKAIEAGHTELISGDIDPTPSSVLRLDAARMLRSAPAAHEAPTLIAQRAIKDTDRPDSAITVTPASLQRRRPMLLVAVVGLGFLGLAGTGLWWLQRSQPVTASANASSAVAAETERQVTLEFVTRPEAAEVWEGSRKLGLTPLKLPVAASSLIEASPRRFELRLEGYRRVELEQGPTDSQVVELRQDLEPEHEQLATPKPDAAGTRPSARKPQPPRKPIRPPSDDDIKVTR
ncbi:MAG: serine/threonine-protein kinase [Pseudomonadota bacterium]